MVFGIFSGRGVQGLIYTLFGALILSTLWVTSLTVLSSSANASDLLTQAGTQILNPFLVDHDLGLSPSSYATLEANARANPEQPLDLSVLNVRVLGREIVGRDYADTVHLVFSRVAAIYYNGGAAAAFRVPAQLQQELPNFALFNPDTVPVIPGGPTVAQLPPFVQPLFIFTGLTPATFTASGHQRLLGLLPWFWGLAILLGLVAVVLNRSQQKLSGLAKGVIHGAWPIVAIVLGAWVLSHIATATLAPYAGILEDIRGAFLPVYGSALLVGLASLGLLTWMSQGRPAAGGDAGAVAGQAAIPAPTTTMNMAARTANAETDLVGQGLITADEVAAVLGEPVALDRRTTHESQGGSFFGIAVPDIEMTTIAFTGTRSPITVNFSVAQGTAIESAVSRMYQRLDSYPGLAHVTGLGDDAYEGDGYLVTRQGKSYLMIAINKATSSAASSVSGMEHQLAQMVLNKLRA